MLRPKIPLDEFETVLNAAFAARYRRYAGALVSFAFGPDADGGAEIVSCRWEFVDEPEPPRPTVTYPMLVLGESWFPMEDAVGELLSVLRGQTTLGTCMLREPVTELEEVDTLREAFTGWPEAAFAASFHSSYLFV